jgi:uncharacterized protein DUF6624
MKHQDIARQLFLILLFFGLCANSPLAAQEAREGDAAHQALRRELIKMGNEDQKYRNELVALMKRLPEADNQQVVKKFVAVGKKQAAIDKKLMKRLEEIIQKYGWPTISMVGTEASGAAFLIVQHADLVFQKKYFPLLKQAAAQKEARPDHVAMMEDRMLMGEGKKQIYGTGLRTDDVTKELKLWPIENEEEVDARRAAVGLPPMAEYLKMVGLTYNPPKKNN